MFLGTAGSGEWRWGAGQQRQALAGACPPVRAACSLLFELGCETVGLILPPAFVWLLDFSFIWRRSGLSLAIG